MKRLSLALVFTCCAIAAVAQDEYRVKFKGPRPTITDFAWAFLFSDEDDEEECGHEAIAGFEQALINYRAGKPQKEGTTFVVDKKNGYILYEWRYESRVKTQEMCYWNESDGKHILFAFNNLADENEGKPVITETSCLTFCRYNKATKKMRICDTPGFQVEYYDTSYSLPRSGKDIIVTKWNPDGGKTQKTLKWNGRKFIEIP